MFNGCMPLLRFYMTLTCDLQRDSVSLIVNAHHNFAAVQAGVTGSQACKSQTGIVSVIAVTRKRYPTLKSLFHLVEERENMD